MSMSMLRVCISISGCGAYGYDLERGCVREFALSAFDPTSDLHTYRDQQTVIEVVPRQAAEL